MTRSEPTAGLFQVQNSRIRTFRLFLGGFSLEINKSVSPPAVVFKDKSFRLSAVNTGSGSASAPHRDLCTSADSSLIGCSVACWGGNASGSG